MRQESKLIKIARLLSCYDFRVEKVPGLKENSKYYYLRRLAEQMPYKLHQKFLEPLEVSTLVCIKRDMDTAKKLLKSSDTRETDLPLAGFVQFIYIFPDGTSMVAWYKVNGIDYSEVYTWGEKCFDAIDIPVMDCEGTTDYSPEGIEARGAKLRELLEYQRPRIRTALLAYVIIAALDANPLITFKELRQAIRMAASMRDVDEYAGLADGFELRLRYLYRYYRALSSANVIGRVWFSVLKPELVEGIGQPVTGLLETSPDCAEQLYGFLAASRLGSRILYPRQSGFGVYAPVVLTWPGVAEALRAFAEICPYRISVRLRSGVLPFPFEYYDPLEDKWKTEPNVGFAQMLKKMRLVVEQQARAKQSTGQGVSREEEEELEEEEEAVAAG